MCFQCLLEAGSPPLMLMNDRSKRWRGKWGGWEALPKTRPSAYNGLSLLRSLRATSCSPTHFLPHLLQCPVSSRFTLGNGPQLAATSLVCLSCRQDWKPRGERDHIALVHGPDIEPSLAQACEGLR